MGISGENLLLPRQPFPPFLSPASVGELVYAWLRCDAMQDSKAGCRDVKVVFRLEEIELSDSPFFPDQARTLWRQAYRQCGAVPLIALPANAHFVRM
eukprot:114200-Chlamydomonas_euryale.AAC.1